MSITTQYRFTLADGTDELFTLLLDERTVEIANHTVADPPAWTELGFHQCPNCPLEANTVRHCPAATRLVNLVGGFARVLSYERVSVEVRTAERTISQTTTAQQAVGSLMGLIMAASGCPQTAFFRPMARFHLPWATREETTYRAASMYLLAQYFVHLEGGKADLTLTGLTQRYEAVQTVNRAFIERLRAASEQDSTMNALIVLDTRAMTLPWAVEDSLGGLRPLFEPYLR